MLVSTADDDEYGSPVSCWHAARAAACCNAFALPRAQQLHLRPLHTPRSLVSKGALCMRPLGLHCAEGRERANVTRVLRAGDLKPLLVSTSGLNSLEASNASKL